jgi:serine/threonine-protein kinase
MVRTVLDGNGRLRDFAAVPPDDAGVSPPVSTDTVFRAMQLDPAAFTETPPTVLPATPFDQRLAWKGQHPVIPDTTITLDAAWWKGRVVQAHLTFPYMGAGRAAAGPSTFARVAGGGSQILLWVGGFLVLLLAVRNWKLERADHQGARRIAMACFLLSGIAWAGRVHVAGIDDLFELGTNAIADALLSASIIWLVYLALEPAVRARWPHSIVTWNRVLAGRWLDAQVGSDILLGAAVGAGLWAVFKAVTVLGMNSNEPSSWDASLLALLGTRQWIASQAINLGEALRLGLFGFLAIFGLRRLLRNDLLAAVAASLLFTLQEGQVMRAHDWVGIAAFFVFLYACLIFVLLRFGLVATIVAVFFANGVNIIVLGGDWKGWYTASSLATLAIFLGIAVFAFWRSLGGRELIGADEAG